MAIQPHEPCPCGAPRKYEQCCQESDRNTDRDHFIERVAIRIGGRELYGKTQSLSALKDILNAIPLGIALAELTSVGIILANSKPTDRVNDQLTAHFLNRYQLGRFNKAKNKDKRPCSLFSEQGLLLLIQIARNYCDKSAKDWTLVKYRHELGRAMLLVNDILTATDSYEDEKEGESRIDALNRLTPFLMRQKIFVNSDQYRYLIPRSVLVFDKLNAVTKNKFDINAVTLKTCGFDLPTFFSAAFLVHTYWQSQTYQRWDPKFIVINPDNVFSKMPAEKADRFKNAISYFVQDAVDCAPELPAEEDLDGWRKFVYEFYDLRKMPLLKLENSLFCSSMSFLEDLWWHAPYYLALDNTKDEEKERFFAYMGDSFEDYVFYVTKEAFKDSCSKRVIKDKVPFNDCVVELNPEWLVAIETKAARPTKNMTSGNTPLLDMKEFKSKIRNGLEQLAERIRDFRAETGYKKRITPCLTTMGFLPLDSMFWELINKGIEDTGLLADLNNDYPLICDPVGWEVFCALVRSGVSARDILNNRLTNTSWKTGAFKDYLYRIVCKTGEPPHDILISLFEDTIEDVASNFDRARALSRSTNPKEWAKAFPVA